MSFTTHVNLPAQKTIEKLGFVRDTAGDFEHPRLPAGHALRRHFLYRVRNEEP